MAGSSIIYCDSDQEEGSRRNFLDVVGRIEQPLFLPSFDVSDLLSTSSLDSFRFLSAEKTREQEHLVYPSLEEVWTPIAPLSAADIDSMLETMNCDNQEGGEMAWLPNWVDRAQPPPNENRSYNSYLRLWRQYLTCLSCTDESSYFQRKQELRSLESELVRWSRQIDFTSIPEDVQSIQGVLGHFDVFAMTENKQSRVVSCTSPNP